MAKATVEKAPKGEKVTEIVKRSQEQLEAFRGPRARLKNQTDQTIPIVAVKVFCNVFSTGPRASLIAMPLHEIPLARRKIEVLHQELHIDPSWPEGTARERGMTAADLLNEHERLRMIYVFADGDAETNKYDLLSDLYGRPHEGRMKAVIKRQHDAWKALATKRGDNPFTKEDFEALVKLALPEGDFAESQFEA